MKKYYRNIKRHAGHVGGLHAAAGVSSYVLNMMKLTPTFQKIIIVNSSQVTKNAIVNSSQTQKKNSQLVTEKRL